MKKPPTRDYVLEICPDDRAIIDQVWEKYVKTRNAPVVAERLNAAGIKTKWGGAWDAKDVYRAIDNPLYVGQWPGDPNGERMEALRIMSDDEYQHRLAMCVIADVRVNPCWRP